MEGPFCSTICHTHQHDTYYHPKIVNNVIPTYNEKPLWDIPLPTTTLSSQEQQEQPPIYCALSAYTQPTLEALVIYLHSCAGWPVTETWCSAIANGNYLSWPHLSQFTDPACIRKHLPKSRQRTMGNMKAIQSNTQPTTRSTTKDNNEKENTKDGDDGSISILAPPRTQLERQKGHHIAFRIINLSTTKDLKGVASTDLAGHFPFTSSKGNNYIMCMYDYMTQTLYGCTLSNHERTLILLLELMIATKSLMMLTSPQSFIASTMRFLTTLFL